MDIDKYVFFNFYQIYALFTMFYSKENHASVPCSVKKEPAEVIEINSESDLDSVLMCMLPRIATGE